MRSLAAHNSYDETSIRKMKKNWTKGSNRNIRVGQGSALSPVLSARYIAPVMKLYHMNPVSLKTSLLSFVDDGTVAAQSKSLDENIETLKEAYTLLLSLFVALGLVLEHSKTEYFIFDRSHSDYSPGLIPVHLHLQKMAGWANY